MRKPCYRVRLSFILSVTMKNGEHPHQQPTVSCIPLSTKNARTWTYRSIQQIYHCLSVSVAVCRCDTCCTVTPTTTAFTVRFTVSLAIRIPADITPVIQAQAAKSAVQVGMQVFSVDHHHHHHHYQQQQQQQLRMARPLQHHWWTSCLHSSTDNDWGLREDWSNHLFFGCTGHRFHSRLGATVRGVSSIHDIKWWWWWWWWYPYPRQPWRFRHEHSLLEASPKIGIRHKKCKMENPSGKESCTLSPTFRNFPI